MYVYIYICIYIIYIYVYIYIYIYIYIILYKHLPTHACMPAAGRAAAAGLQPAGSQGPSLGAKKAAVHGLGLVRQCGDTVIAIHLHSSGRCDLICSRRQSNKQFNNVAHRVLLIRPRIVSVPGAVKGLAYSAKFVHQHKCL